jgi:hypothetical protein
MLKWSFRGLASLHVSMSLALPVTKFRFKEELQEDFVQVLGAVCTRYVDIESVADKPHSFRGGGETTPPHIAPAASLFCLIQVALNSTS